MCLVCRLIYCGGGRRANMASGYHLRASWLSSFLLSVVQATLSCNEVCCTDLDTSSIYVAKSSFTWLLCCSSAYGICCVRICTSLLESL